MLNMEKNLGEFEERIEPGALADHVGREMPLRLGIGGPLLGTVRIVSEDVDGLCIEVTGFTGDLQGYRLGLLDGWQQKVDDDAVGSGAD